MLSSAKYFRDDQNPQNFLDFISLQSDLFAVIFGQFFN